MPAVHPIHLSLNSKWIFLFGLQIVSIGSYSVLVHLNEEQEKVRFSSNALNFLIEFFKFAISLFIQTGLTFRQFNLKNSLYFSVPGLLYFINNNLAVYIQYYMDSTSYQLLCNFKIFTTAIMYYFIMGKMLSKIKWFSLVLLFLVGVFYLIGNLKSSVSDSVKHQNISISSSNAMEIYITDTGVLMMIVYCLISGLTGVYTEFILKANLSDSLFLQNIYLYTYGSIFNLFSYIFKSPDHKQGFFAGFNIFTWIIIVTQIYNGLIMSILMKYSNNIVKLFVVSLSLFVNIFFSIILFSLELNIYFCLVFAATLTALCIYFCFDD